MSFKSLFKAHGMGLFNLVLCVLAAALGADSAFAMAEVVTTTGATEKVDDSKGLGTQMPGEGASQSEVRESGFEPEEIDQAIAEFQAYQTPVNACISTLAEKVNVSSYEVIHYRSATPVFKVSTTSQVAEASQGDEELTFYTTGQSAHTSSLDKKSARLLYECKTLFVPGVQGYDASGNPDGMLALYVTLNDRANGVVKCKILNGLSTATTTIPSGSEILIGAVAASESQMQVAPDNFEPVPTTLYLQKRIFNIVMTDEWINGKKKVKFAEEDMRKGALYAYKVNNEITDLLGSQSKFKVEAGKDMADEYVYTTRGILRQVNMYYALDNDEITAEDLTAIAKMQFTKFSANREAQVFCGQGFVEKLLNMDLTVHKEISFENVDFMGMTVKGWKNNFGTLNFIYTPVFDLIGFSNCAAVFDIKNARNYVKRAARTDSVDMKKGTGETREAKRDIYSQIYGVALRGYNSMIIGPTSEMSSIGVILSNISKEVSAKASLTSSEQVSGVIYYLTAAVSADNSVHTPAFPAGVFVEWDAANTTFALYKGQIATTV